MLGCDCKGCVDAQNDLIIRHSQTIGAVLALGDKAVRETAKDILRGISEVAKDIARNGEKAAIADHVISGVHLNDLQVFAVLGIMAEVRRREKNLRPQAEPVAEKPKDVTAPAPEASQLDAIVMSQGRLLEKLKSMQYEAKLHLERINTLESKVGSLEANMRELSQQLNNLNSQVTKNIG